MGLESFLAFISIVAFIWIVYDIIVNQKKMDTFHKIFWIVAGFFFNLLTALIYYFIVKRK